LEFALTDPMIATPVLQRTIAAVLERQVAERPDKIAVIDETGRQMTFAELRKAAACVGSAIRGAGVQRQEPVLIMLDNHIDIVTTWAGLGLTATITVPINTAYKGEMLRYVINQCEAKVAIIEAHYCGRIAKVADGLTELQTIYVRGTGGELPERFTRRDFADLLNAESAEFDPPHVSDIACIIYTSGTEGPSKAVLCPHGHAFQTSASYTFQTTPEDVVFVVLPLFHAGGLFAGVLNALRGGATAVIGSFSASRFWEDVRSFGCTQTLLIGAMVDFLWKAPASASDRDHPMRNITVVPAMPYMAKFAERFGVSVASSYGQSETGTTCISTAEEAQPFLCGYPRSIFKVKIVDDDDVEVAPGINGEIVVRPMEPWSVFRGYHRNLQATVNATRNQWIHTGDVGHMNERGQVFFVDRKKDALRRRGENVSSMEVETHLLEHADVAQAAIVSVPSEHLEDDIKAVVVLAPGAAFDPEALLHDLYNRLPYFMVPRYYEAIDKLPLTPTGKVAKVELRKRGVTAETWDCEAHGFAVTRSALKRSAPKEESRSV
jgi:crotonobetaine/carnitine-CoA ligase